MNFTEFANTDQGKAAQIVVAGALDLHGVTISNDEFDKVNQWLKEANDLSPDPLDIAGAGIIIAKDIVEETPAKWDNVVVSKVSQIYEIFIDTTKGALERVKDLIGVVFQSKRKSIKKGL